MTIELGLYFVPAILRSDRLVAPLRGDFGPTSWRSLPIMRGIRIEDDVLVTATGHEVLTAGLEKGAMRSKAMWLAIRRRFADTAVTVVLDCAYVWTRPHRTYRDLGPWAALCSGQSGFPASPAASEKAIRSFRRDPRSARPDRSGDDVRRPFEDLRAALRDEPPAPNFPPPQIAPPLDPPLSVPVSSESHVDAAADIAALIATLALALSRL